MTNLHPFSEKSTWWGLHRTGRVSALSSELAAKFLIGRGWVIFLGEPEEAARAAGELARTPLIPHRTNGEAREAPAPHSDTPDAPEAGKSQPLTEQQLEMFAA